MAKYDMTNIDPIILVERNKTNIDEKFIADLAIKGVEMAEVDLKAIDAKYDKKFDNLSEEKKKRYHEHYNNLAEERKEIYKLLEKSQSVEERSQLLNEYVNIIGRIDAMYALAENYDEKTKNKLIEMKKDEKSKTIVWQIAKVATPLVVSAIWAGLVALSNNGKKY